MRTKDKLPTAAQMAAWVAPNTDWAKETYPRFQFHVVPWYLEDAEDNKALRQGLDWLTERVAPPKVCARHSPKPGPARQRLQLSFCSCRGWCG
jgi:hypothetical protein